MDFQIVTLINQFWHTSRLDIFSQYISRNWWIVIIRAIVVALAMIFKKKYRKFVLFSFVLAGALFYLTSEIGFKTLLVQETGIRPRPYVAHADIIQPIGNQYADSSFPSSHMALTVAMITVLIMLFPAVRPYAILYALLMAWSRIYNGMHYPSDVLVGSILWIICGWIGVVLSRRVFRSK
ncbi:MAG: phosphoesterase PA-phosphatase related protein [uncultured bacterium (gcode 4)]|uniref:Phosphoesterase PA-phosphatase related protein n=1 Tax=uncultured bacterium (gcode 4) TaxID=1234023 RepID=K1XX50_9BACT|nr:MAG: phosphoesterase PA-phosphatase related protein [uncultured bacterium (gcode 4)]